VASLAVECLFPIAPKKGLLVDLDETLWQGILGDVGVEGVAWSLDRRAQQYGLFQQALGSLAESGVLIGVASKNDPALVTAAFERPDLRLKRAQIFPLIAEWGSKSESVNRILSAWNIAEDSVVFVDDSPMELAEVQERFPAIEFLRFPSDDTVQVLRLIRDLRDRFGKAEMREEDRLRSESLQASAAFLEEQKSAGDGDFLARLQATVTIECLSNGSDARALELINKTNQFNLNGRRFTEAEWAAYFEQPGSFLVTAAYEGRFGPLGKIGVLLGRRAKDGVRVDAWVLSCRAFSRHIDFQMLRHVFAQHGAESIGFCFRQTPRNGPVTNFFRRFSSALTTDGWLDLPARTFCGGLPIAVSSSAPKKWTKLKRSFLFVLRLYFGISTHRAFRRPARGRFRSGIRWHR